MKEIQRFLLLIFMFAASAALAWGPEGHQTVGAIADKLLAGTHAGSEVKSLLHGGKLRTAALWADCAKGVVESNGVFRFVVSPRYPECKPYESTAGQRAMVDFVKRNWDACQPAADEEKCHKQYHYADVAIERDDYRRTDVGTGDHDVVSAINAAIAVLKGDAAPAPFSITSKREALRVLAHYVGDMHQPLHVGAIYLNAAGQKIDPDMAGLDPASKNQGGNQLMHGASKLHGEWDGIPTALTVVKFKTAGTAQAKLVPVTAGPVEGWAATWASESVMASHQAFQGLSFGTKNGVKHTWPVTEPADYGARRSQLQKEQLVKAGARLAQLLKAIFP